MSDTRNSDTFLQPSRCLMMAVLVVTAVGLSIGRTSIPVESRARVRAEIDQRAIDAIEKILEANSVSTTMNCSSSSRTDSKRIVVSKKRSEE